MLSGEMAFVDDGNSSIHKKWIIHNKMNLKTQVVVLVRIRVWCTIYTNSKLQ
jgi:hypothetical protein